MKQPNASPVFLERAGYHRRRLTDAARLLPVLGAILFAAPILWPTAEGGGSLISMSAAIVYIFGAWVLLIACAALFGFRIRKYAQARQEPDAD